MVPGPPSLSSSAVPPQWTSLGSRLSGSSATLTSSPGACQRRGSLGCGTTGGGSWGLLPRTSSTFHSQELRILGGGGQGATDSGPTHRRSQSSFGPDKKTEPSREHGGGGSEAEKGMKLGKSVLICTFPLWVAGAQSQRDLWESVWNTHLRHAT